MLLQEKKWYDSQSLDIPFVAFFDNTHIIGKKIKYSSQFTFMDQISYVIFLSDLFHHKSRGIFSILNDECKFQKPSMENLASNLRNAWDKHESLITWNFCSKKENINFLIRHFSSDVRYSTVC